MRLGKFIESPSPQAALVAYFDPSWQLQATSLSLHEFVDALPFRT